MKNSDIPSIIHSELYIEYVLVMIISFICLLFIYHVATIALRRHDKHSSNKSFIDSNCNKTQHHPISISDIDILNQQSEMIQINEETVLEIDEQVDKPRPVIDILQHKVDQ